MGAQRPWPALFVTQLSRQSKYEFGMTVRFVLNGTATFTGFEFRVNEATLVPVVEPDHTEPFRTLREDGIFSLDGELVTGLRYDGEDPLNNLVAIIGANGRIDAARIVPEPGCSLLWLVVLLPFFRQMALSN